jgi:hypothetical protein
MLSLILAVLLRAQSDKYPAYALVPLSGVTVAGLPAVTSHICVDQFGYLPGEQKVAVISDPQKGYNAFDHYAPGGKLEVRKKTGETAFFGLTTPWNGGAVHEDSGDRGWWFDFSALKTPGQYYVYDPSTQKRSPVFTIGETVFKPVLKAATRMYYYQRQGTPITAKYAEGPWVDGAANLQDAHARYVMAKDDASQERDLSGGWMDAGDTDKYPPFNGDVIHPLLYAYTANPKAFTDDFNIPESGNGLPDILDEVKYQLDWLVRMQFPDGSVPVKMGNIGYSAVYPTSQDHRTRYFGPKDSGATIYTCANFAHAARVYGAFGPWKEFAKSLQDRAVLAWNWFESHPHTYKTDSGEIDSGIANRSDEEQDRMEAFAAIHLFALTGDAKYQAVIKAKAGSARQLAEGLWSPYEVGASEALVDYTNLPNADPSLVAKIKAKLTSSASNDHFAPPASADLYRAWMEPTNYHWGSNIVRSGWGVAALLAAKAGNVDAATKARLRQRAADMLHSFHGVNPFGVVYLTNMGKYGAEHSVMSIYHDRYGAASPFTRNPPPGYVTGGPNQHPTGKAAEGKPSIEWLKSQPRAKSYADFCLGWPESSWEITEPAIYYQAIYVRLVAEFAK